VEKIRKKDRPIDIRKRRGEGGATGGRESASKKKKKKKNCRILGKNRGAQKEGGDFVGRKISSVEGQGRQGKRGPTL